MLYELAEYARKNGISMPPGFKTKKGKWTILLGDDGSYIDVIKDERSYVMCPDLSQPEMIAGGVTRSQFLMEVVSVVANMGEKDSDSYKHLYFIELLKNASIYEPKMQYCVDLLEKTDSLNKLQETLLARKAKFIDKISFKVGDIYLIETTSWHDWWFEFRSSLGNGSTDKQLMRCLMSGELVVPADKNFKISGLTSVGGQAAGSILIGFDKDAFTSYGLQQARNAVCSEEAAAEYRNALEHLISKAPKPIAGALFLHWYKEPLDKEDDLLDYSAFGNSNEKDALTKANQIINSVREGSYPQYLNNRYYIMQISGAGGRIMVRDWLEGKYLDLVNNIRGWYEDLELVQARGNGTSKAFKLAAAQLRMVSYRKNENINKTYERINQELAPVMPRIWRSIIQNWPLPDALAQKSLFYIRSRLLEQEEDSNLDQIACSLLKAWYNRKIKGGTQKMSTNVNPDHPSSAYQAGRMMAVLALIQRRALGKVGANVVQRYYASASSTPALVMGRLIRQAQYHLDKMDAGSAVWYEKHLQEISARLGDGLPGTLTLEEQTLFALGYYQQRADMFSSHKEDEHDENIEGEE